jgi:hypothetical protein
MESKEIALLQKLNIPNPYQQVIEQWTTNNLQVIRHEEAG